MAKTEKCMEGMQKFIGMALETQLAWTWAWLEFLSRVTSVWTGWKPYSIMRVG